MAAPPQQFVLTAEQLQFLLAGAATVAAQNAGGGGAGTATAGKLTPPHVCWIERKLKVQYISRLDYSGRGKDIAPGDKGRPQKKKR